MWDPDQRAAISVLADELQVSGDPFGEWLAIRLRLATQAAEHRPLRIRARVLREQLAPRFVLADNPRLGRPHVIRRLGLITDVAFAEARPARLAELLARLDARFVLRVRLRAEAIVLRACVELLGTGAVAAGLRELALEVVDGVGESDEEGSERMHAELGGEAAALAERLPSLFSLEVDAQGVSLPPTPAGLDARVEWDPQRRTCLGRALSSRDAGVRKRGLERLREHGEHATQLRGPLVRTIEGDPVTQVRAAAFAVVAELGPSADAMFAILGDSARRRDDRRLREWLELVGRAPAS